MSVAFGARPVESTGGSREVFRGTTAERPSWRQRRFEILRGLYIDVGGTDRGWRSWFQECPVSLKAADQKLSDTEEVAKDCKVPLL